MIDESGNSSRRDKDTKNFVIAASIIQDPNSFERAMRDLQKKFNHSIRKKDSGKEIKAHSSTPQMKKFILEKIAKLDVVIDFVFVEKAITSIEGNELHEKMLMEMIERAVKIVPRGYKDVHIIIDRTNKITRAVLKVSLNQIAEKTGHNLSFTMASSSTVPSLRAHDFVVNSIFSNIERQDANGYNIIKCKIIEDPGRMVTI